MANIYSYVLVYLGNLPKTVTTKGLNMLTINQFLKIPEFSDFKLVTHTSEASLENIISAVNIMDNPDAIDWFSPGELLLTSGYFVKDDFSQQEKAMHKLKHINCPALCIKPHQYLKTISQDMIDLANSLDLPIIELPYGLSFSKITHIILSEIIESSSISNKRALTLHQEFFSLSLNGGGVERISETLAEMLNKSVVLLDQYFEPIHFTSPKSSPRRLKQYLTKENFSSSFGEEFFASLPPSFEQLKKPIIREIRWQQEVEYIAISPINIQNKHYGYILLFLKETGLSQLDYLALEYSSMSFALERIRSEELARSKNKVKKDFLLELLGHHQLSPQQLTRLAGIHQINDQINYSIAIIDLTYEASEKKDPLLQKTIEHQTRKMILEKLDRSYSSLNFLLSSFSDQGKIIILVESSSSEKSAELERGQQIIDYLGELNHVKKLKMVIGGSDEFSNLATAYQRAVKTLEISNKLPLNRDLLHYQDLLVHNFLLNVFSKDQMETFVETTLGDLYRYEQANKTQYLDTLFTWINQKFNTSQTAVVLYTHRNTVIYRLEKIEEILKTDLKDPNELLKYQLALIMRYLT